MTNFRVRNRFKPPQGGASWIRLIAEDHVGMDGVRVPYYEYFEHFNASVKRGTICSKVWKEFTDGSMEGSGKCIPCHEIEDGADNISHRRLSAFLMLLLEWHYEVPATDKKGNLLTYQRDSKFHKKGDTIFNRVPEEEAIEKFGRREIRRSGYNKVFGSLMHWSLGVNHLLVLSGTVDDLEQQCRCGGDIVTPLWECPKCGAEYYDRSPGGDCELSDKEIRDRVMKPEKCSSCGRVGLLNPVLDCASEDCKNPYPLRLWDVDLYVGREGEGAQSQLLVRRHRQAPIDERCLDLIPKNNILDRVFAGDSLDYQSEAMKTPNPWKKEEARRHVQDYDEKEKENDEAEDDEFPF